MIKQNQRVYRKANQTRNNSNFETFGEIFSMEEYLIKWWGIYSFLYVFYLRKNKIKHNPIYI